MTTINRIPRLKIWVIGSGENARINAIVLSSHIRYLIFEKYKALYTIILPVVEVALTGNLKKELAKANKQEATHTVIMGGDGNSTIKDMATSDQKTFKTTYIPDYCCFLLEELA